MTMASASGLSWLVSIQILLISIGVVSIAVALKVSVIPLILELSISYLPPLWSSLVAWLRPPFLYLIINGIIITIAASSRFHRDRHESSRQVIADPPERVADVGVAVVATRGDVEEVCEEKHVVAESGGCLMIEDGCSEGDDEVEEFIDSRSSAVEMDSTDIMPVNFSPVTKHHVSSRFIHRKSLSVISEGGSALRTSDYEGHETTEATWRAITDGRAVTPAIGVRRLSRWDDLERQISSLNSDHPPPPQTKKLETFNDRQGRLQPPSTPSPVKQRKEPLLSPEELNRRVEAFIERFNEGMRLQRQESLDQLKEMMGRGL